MHIGSILFSCGFKEMMSSIQKPVLPDCNILKDTLNPFENNGFFCILYVPKNDLELFINKSKIKWENKNITQKY